MRQLMGGVELGDVVVEVQIKQKKLGLLRRLQQRQEEVES